MPGHVVLSPLVNAYQDFVATVLSLSDEQFLSPMDEWAPREIVAHLVGWNDLMIEASLSILEGNAPGYYADTPYDYSHVNSGFTSKYSSTSKQELLADLKSSLERFKAFVLALPDEELTADHGVRHYSGNPATVSRIISSLAGDYRSHTQQIKDWLIID
jgi:hypothetical protein